MSANERVGRVALVRYRGGITGREPIDDRSGDPLRVVLGVGQLPKGMDDAFLDMAVGEKRTVVIPCELGFGEHDPNGVQIYPRTFIQLDRELAVGDVLSWVNPASGQPIPVRVIEADAQLVTLDFNHPFAGEELTYELELVELE